MIIALLVVLVILTLILTIGGGNKCLPDYLRKRHDDWRWYVAWVQRGWTARCGWAWPMPPKRILGDSGWKESDWPSVVINAETHYFNHHPFEYFKKIRKILPIAKPGHFLISAVWFMKFIPLPMWVKTFKNGDYISLGIVRWDDVDSYYDLWRVRGHGLLGYISMALILLPAAAFGYFVAWPWIVDMALSVTFFG